tara:strand:- start:129 stop:524 length:396 start_codon:yes stop_codon:yes gene_type:complete
MKKTVSMMLLVLSFNLTTQAQKKSGKLKVQETLKQMTMDLNLTEEQQNKLKPILIDKIADKELLAKKKKALKASSGKPSKEESRKMKGEKAAKKATRNSKIANILNKEQFEKFEIMAKAKKENAKKKDKQK